MVNNADKMLEDIGYKDGKVKKKLKNHKRDKYILRKGADGTVYLEAKHTKKKTFK